MKYADGYTDVDSGKFVESAVEWCTDDWFTPACDMWLGELVG